MASLRRLVLCVLLLAAGLLAPGSTPHAQEDQGVLAGFLSRLLSTPASRVSIGAVEGALSSNAVIRNVTVADPQGVYLAVDEIRLVWRRAALFLRRIEVQDLQIGRIEIVRRPARDPSEAPAEGPLLPELPLKLQVDAFALRELVLGETILGTAARFSASGNASLGPPAEGLNATLDVRRLDAPGTTTLRLGFAPATEQLDLALNHDEPAGGIAARMMNVPGLPPVRLDLSGSGRLDAWRGRLAFSAGEGADARGEAQIDRVAGGRRLGLDLEARVESLLPAAVAAVFAGRSSLAAAVTYGDDGAAAIERLRLASDLAELTIAGRLDADQVLDVTARARALPNEAGATRRGETRLENLAFEATARGPALRPRIDGRLDLRGLQSPALTLGALEATLAAQSVADQRYRVELDGRAGGVALADRGLAEALGDAVTLTVRADVDEDGVADVETASIDTPNLALGFAGRSGARLLDGTARGEVKRLAALSTLARRPLSGRATVSARLRGDPSASRLAIALDGRTSDLALGQPAADRIAGPTVTLSGTVGTLPGALRIETLTLRGRHAEAALRGRLAEELALDAELALADLSQVDRQLAGRARVTANVSGPSEDPTVALVLSAPDARALGRPLRDMGLTVNVTRAVSAPALVASAGGDVDGKTLIADVTAAVANGGWTLDRLVAQLGSVSFDGSGRIDAAGLASGRMIVAAGDLDDLSPLVLTRLRGSLNAVVTASAEDGRQRLTVAGEGRRIAAGATTLEALRADIRAEDLFGRPAIDGEATVDRLLAGREAVELIALTARSAAGASDLRLTARARGFDLAAAGRLVAGTPLRFDLASFTATRQGARIALVAPASLTLADGHVRTERLALAVQGGEVEVRGRMGADLDLTLAARRVPLAAVDIVAPGTGLAGTLDASATLAGPASAPRGPFQASVRGLSAPQTRSAGLPAFDITASGRAEGARASLQARIAGGRAISAEITGSVPMSGSGALDLRARGTLDAAMLNAMLAGGGQRVTGRVSIDGTVRGTAANPDLAGAATLSGGSFTDLINGVALTGIEARATGRGNAVVLERASARTRNGGTIQASGRVTADADRGFPADLRITASNAQLVASDLVEAVASLNLAISGPLATTPRLSGRIDVQTVEVRVPDRLPSAAEPLQNARHVAPPAQTRARLAQIARQRAAAGVRRGPAFNASLDLLVDAPGRVFVRGRGIDAELGGTVRLTGSSSAPQASGAFEMRRGRLALLTQRLNFTRGRLTFPGGDVVPDIDFIAETQANEVTARIAITGRASEPQFTLTSSPGLPQDEVLSRLLFARASAGLSPFQAVQLAQAVAVLAGAGGTDAFERTRRALGVDDLDVNMGAAGPTVGISRAISDRVRVGVRTGTRPENSAVGADIDLTRRLRIQTEIGADGRAAVGIGAEIEY